MGGWYYWSKPVRPDHQKSVLAVLAPRLCLLVHLVPPKSRCFLKQICEHFQHHLIHYLWFKGFENWGLPLIHLGTLMVPPKILGLSLARVSRWHLTVLVLFPCGWGVTREQKIAVDFLLWLLSFFCPSYKPLVPTGRWWLKNSSVLGKSQWIAGYLIGPVETASTIFAGYISLHHFSLSF